MSEHYFVTVDAETEVIAAGVENISSIRDQVEQELGCQIPLTWFVRFQRRWRDSVRQESLDFFKGPLNPDRVFDGYALAKPQLLRMQQRGDEIGWHYHAYNYVHCDDLNHNTKLAILKADMQACAVELRRLHPEFALRALRFGWWYVPDYAVFETLGEVGFDVDSSIKPEASGRLEPFNIDFRPPPTREIAKIDGTWFFPRRRTYSLHDWTVVSHDFNWHVQSQAEADRRLAEFHRELTNIAKTMQSIGGCCTTYRDYLRADDVTADRSSEASPT